MRYYFDCEFIEDGRIIDLISIGIASDDERELYMVSSEFDAGKANDFVRRKVLNHIPGSMKRHTRAQIAQAIKDFVAIPVFVGDLYPEYTREHWMPEWWAYYADYDWVALCQLYGRMIDLPQDFGKYCRDLKQEFDRLNTDGTLVLPGQKGTNHVAINDARWCQEAHHFLLDLEHPTPF